MEAESHEGFFGRFFRARTRLILASSFRRVSFGTVRTFRKARSSLCQGVATGSFGAAAGFMVFLY